MTPLRHPLPSLHVSHTGQRRRRRAWRPELLPCLVMLGGLAAFACASGENTTDPIGGGGSVTTGGSGGSVAGSGGTPMTGSSGKGGTAGGPNAGAGGTSSGGTGVGGGNGATGGAGGSAGETGTGGTAGAGGSGPPGPVMFEPNIRLNDDEGRGNQVETSIATGPNGEVLVGWVDSRSGLRCGYATSTDGGATWSENVLIMPESGGITGDVTVAIDADGTMMAVCMDYGVEQIRLMTSTNGGVDWSEARRIQGAPDKPWIGASPTEPGVAFVTWLGGSAGIIKTTDAGTTWDRVLDLESLYHGTTVNVGSSGVVHIAYTPNGGPVRYLRSEDLGETWDDARTIGQTGTFCWGSCGARQNPVIGAGADPTGQYVAVIWSAERPEGEGDEDIWVIYSSDSGDTWSDPIRANDNESSSRQFQPWVAVDRHGHLHAVWTDERNGQQDTYYARMLDPEEGFEENIQVNDDSGSVSGNILDYKGIAIQGTDVMVVFPDMRDGNNDLYFAKAPGAAGP